MRSSSPAIRSALSRRHLIAAGSAAGLGVVFGRGQSRANDNGTPAAISGTQPDGSWSFTDDRGITITLPKMPQRIVAQTTVAAALWDLGIRPVGIIGPNRLPDGSNDFQAGNIDFDATVTVGDWGAESLELDIEQLVALQPELILDMCYGESFWYTESARETLTQIAPMAGISMEKVSIKTSIERIEALAIALGADLNVPKIVADRTAFAEAEQELIAAIAAKPGLTVLSCSPSVQNVYICSPRWMTDLHFFHDLGLDVRDHSEDDFFQLISWEEINRFPADLILVDIRATQSTTGEFSEVATWKSLPAVQANQIGPWYAGAPYGRARFAPIMTELAEVISSCRTDLV